MVIDERGRLFGRVNLIDALVGLVVLGLVPLAYGAFVLFRVPAPTVATVAPNRLVANKPAVVVISGTNLRTYMAVYLGAVRAEDFRFDELGRGRASMPPLPPGTYDLVLADEGQELQRIPRAVTVVAPPTTLTTVKVRFVAPPEVLAHVMPGIRDTSTGNAGATDGAELTEIGSDRQPVSAIAHDAVLGRIIETPQPMVAFTATVRVPVVVTPAGATYRDRPVKVGAQFLFEFASGAMSGAIQDVQSPSPSTE